MPWSRNHALSERLPLLWNRSFICLKSAKVELRASNKWDPGEDQRQDAMTPRQEEKTKNKLVFGGLRRHQPDFLFRPPRLGVLALHDSVRNPKGQYIDSQ